jgi:hypothetical protein
VVAVKGRVEAGHLGQLGQLGGIRENRSDRREIVRLVQRSERHVALQSSDHLGIYQNRVSVIRAAMDDAVADRIWLNALLVPQPCARRLQRRRHIGNGRDVIFAIDKAFAVGPARPQSRTRADSVHLALDRARERAAAINGKHLKFDAGRARVGDQNVFHRPSGGGYWRIGPARVRVQHRYSAGGHPRAHGIRPRSENDGHPRAEHDAGRIRVGKERQILGEHVARF